MNHIRPVLLQSEHRRTAPGHSETYFSNRTYDQIYLPLWPVYMYTHSTNALHQTILLLIFPTAHVTHHLPLCLEQSEHKCPATRHSEHGETYGCKNDTIILLTWVAPGPDLNMVFCGSLKSDPGDSSKDLRKAWCWLKLNGLSPADDGAGILWKTYRYKVYKS